jgi:hypothetical protein
LEAGLAAGLGVSDLGESALAESDFTAVPEEVSLDLAESLVV